jgi:hypothetical protein
MSYNNQGQIQSQNSWKWSPSQNFSFMAPQKERIFTLSLTTLVTLHHCPSTIRQDTEHEEKVRHLSLRYKNSITSYETHENWAPVSTKAGTLLILKSCITHRGTLLVAAVTLHNPLRTTAQEACLPLDYRLFPGRSNFWWQCVLRCPTWTHVQHFAIISLRPSLMLGMQFVEPYLSLPEHQTPSILWCC